MTNTAIAGRSVYDDRWTDQTSHPSVAVFQGLGRPSMRVKVSVSKAYPSFGNLNRPTLLTQDYGNISSLCPPRNIRSLCGSGRTDKFVVCVGARVPKMAIHHARIPTSPESAPSQNKQKTSEYAECLASLAFGILAIQRLSWIRVQITSLPPFDTTIDC